MDRHQSQQGRDRFAGWMIRNLIWLVPATALTLVAWAVWRHVEDGTPITIRFAFEVLEWWVFGLFLPIVLAPPAAIYLAVVWRLPTNASMPLRRVAAVLLGPAVFAALTGTLALLAGVSPGAALPVADVLLWLLVLPAIFGCLIRLPVRSRGRGSARIGTAGAPTGPGPTS